MVDLTLIDRNTMDGLMRSLMEANFQDAIRAQQLQESGFNWDPDTMSKAKDLEMALSSLCNAVHNAMLSGELTPFRGYRKWLVENGFAKDENAQ